MDDGHSECAERKEINVEASFVSTLKVHSAATETTRLHRLHLMLHQESTLFHVLGLANSELCCHMCFGRDIRLANQDNIITLGLGYYTIIIIRLQK